MAVTDLRYIHSDIFDRLQDEDDDLFGLVAYGLYQKRKRQWIDHFEKLNGRSPSEDEIRAYCSTYSDDVLGDLKSKANNIVFGVSEGLVDVRMEEMQIEAFNARTTQELANLNSKIDKISGYKHHIFGHMAGFVLLAFAVWVGLFILHHEPSIAQLVGAG